MKKTNNIKDIESLKNLKNLKTLILKENPIALNQVKSIEKELRLRNFIY